MAQRLIKALDTALEATMTREELNRFTSIELSPKHSFNNNVPAGAYPYQRIEYIGYLERRGKLRQFVNIFLKDMEDNQRTEISDLRKAIADDKNQAAELSAGPTFPPPPSPPPLNEQTKAEVHKLIGANRVPKALEVLETATTGNPELFGELTILKGKYKKLERDELMGILSFDQASVQRARIVSAILGLLRT